MHLKVCKLGCDRTVNYVCLFEVPYAFRAVHNLVLEGLSYIFLHRIVESFATIAVCLVSMGQ